MVNDVGRLQRTIWSPSPQAVACEGSDTVKTNGLPDKAIAVHKQTLLSEHQEKLNTEDRWLMKQMWNWSTHE